MTPTLFLFFPFGVALVLYGVDVFVFHLSGAFHLATGGVLTQLWMLWFSQCLCEFRYQRVAFMTILLSLVIGMHSVQGWTEVFFPLLLLVFWAMSYHTFFVISTTHQRRFFVLFSYVLLGMMMHLKIALQVPDFWAYIVQFKWVVVLGVNIVLYGVGGERLFLSLNTWIERRYAFRA